MYISDCIRLIQWNCCGIRNKLPQLQHIASEVDIMCLQESLLWSHNYFRINGFKVIRNDIITSNQRGTCILIRENLIFRVFNFSKFYHPSWEIQGIILPLDGDKDSLVIINIYRYPNQITPFNIFNLLLTTLTNNFRKIVLVGDFNAHHPWWGCKYENSAGKILSHVIDNYNLIILNDRSFSTFLHPTSKHSS